MNAQSPLLQIQTYGTDGAIRMFRQDDPEVAKHTLMKLNPGKLFEEDTVTIHDGSSEATFAASGLARIDLITDRLSVWDFPFVLGAHVELTEAEYRECLDDPHQWASMASQSAILVVLKITMVNGQHYFFSMEVVGGLSAVRMSRLHSMLKAGRFIFGLRTGGIGVLNLANMMQFSVYPNPPDARDSAQSAHFEGPRDQSDGRRFRAFRQVEEGRPPLTRLAGAAED